MKFEFSPPINANSLDHTIIERIWQRDPDLWKPNDDAHAAVIKNRLGWLDVVAKMRAGLDDLLQFQTDVKTAGFANAVLLGMGGSSLCPEVLRTSFGRQPGFPAFHVLDTTDPAAILELTGAIDPRTTLFIAASKSGTTLETRSHLEYFWNAVTDSGAEDPGKNFVVITDPGSPLLQVAQERNFRRAFENPSDIGGRYSALSYFGLVPAAVIGIDLPRLLQTAEHASAACRERPDTNPGFQLGTFFGQEKAEGRDKITILTPDVIGEFSLWAEQLIAESTGKEGRGLIPIGSEPIGRPEVYSGDRLFVALEAPDQGQEYTQKLDALAAAGVAMTRGKLADVFDLGAEFFAWEFATAVAAVSLQIDPFDEPNVQESKDNTKKMLQTFESTGSLPAQPASVTSGETEFFGASAATDVPQALNGFLEENVRPGDYVAIMAYCNPSESNLKSLQSFRVAIRNQYEIATTLGFGPRFLHSTGQLHKGGPNTGVFIQITVDDQRDVPIPGQPFGFSTLKQAQAAGDLQSLHDHERRAVRVHIKGDLAGNLQQITGAIQSVISSS